MSHSIDKIESWEKEKSQNLIKAFVRVMQGEPADGGNDEETTKEYLIEFRNHLLSSLEEEVKKKREYAQKLESIMAGNSTKGYMAACEDILSLISSFKEETK